MTSLQIYMCELKYIIRHDKNALHERYHCAKYAGLLVH